MSSDEKIFLWLLDDDLDDADLLGMILLDEFPHVHYQHFPHFEELLTALTLQRPHFSLLERMVPLHGMECLKRIRAADKKLCLITYTASSRREDILACYEQGANLYLVKPSLFGSMKKTVELLLSKTWDKLSAAHHYVAEGEMRILEKA